ncbi:FecR domain-containing protein [Desulfobacter latus]|uniref:FecR domain-containing protein n=1 Tax=Desulfobacter latus TaxID=2292 RepID=A0A850T9N4_9BACT|nr:FecR domain-containing protein [Desulfobacter latus]NWH04917.1 FecR domain-containing protein [Desulfobacter latus]
MTCEAAVATKGNFATLGDFKGEVMVKNAGAWAKPALGMPLYSGTKIVTKEGTASVVFKDGATMFIDVFSSIRTIDQLLNEEPLKDGKNRIRKIRIMLGRAKYEEQPINERETRIELPTAVAALRGTGGWFGANEHQNSLGKLYEGRMDTSGRFQEMIPKILTLAQALNSPTFQASLMSSQAGHDPLLNVKEIQSEVKTFAANTDPDVQAAVQSVIQVISPMLKAIETKLEKAKAASGVKEKAEQTEKKAIETQKDSTVIEVAGLLKESITKSTDTFVEATQESINADIVLLLETLKGDEEGVKIANTVKEQNDAALEIAQVAVETSNKAVALVETAENNVALGMALTVANTVKNAVNTVATGIRTANISVALTAQDNKAAATKVMEITQKTSSATDVAANTITLVNEALENFKNTEDVDLALTVAQAAETTSKITHNTAQIGSRAVEPIKDDADNIGPLTQAVETAVQSLGQAEQALETLGTALDTGKQSFVKEATQTIEQSSQDMERLKSEVDIKDDMGPPVDPEANRKSEKTDGIHDPSTAGAPLGIDIIEAPLTQDDQSASPR